MISVFVLSWWQQKHRKPPFPIGNTFIHCELLHGHVRLPDCKPSDWLNLQWNQEKSHGNACDYRRSATMAKADFPNVDFSHWDTVLGIPIDTKLVAQARANFVSFQTLEIVSNCFPVELDIGPKEFKPQIVFAAWIDGPMTKAWLKKRTVAVEWLQYWCVQTANQGRSELYRHFERKWSSSNLILQTLFLTSFGVCSDSLNGCFR